MRADSSDQTGVGLQTDLNLRLPSMPVCWFCGNGVIVIPLLNYHVFNLLEPRGVRATKIKRFCLLLDSPWLILWFSLALARSVGF